MTTEIVAFANVGVAEIRPQTRRVGVVSSKRGTTLVLAVVALFSSICHAQDGRQKREAILLEAAPLAVRAEMIGQQLFVTYESKVPDNRPVIRDAIRAAKSPIRTELCDGVYRAVVLGGEGAHLPIPWSKIPLDGPDDLLVYMIGEVDRDKTIMFGRHFRVHLSSDGNTVRGVVPSTKECLYVPLSALAQPHRYMKYDLSPAPTEVHAFLSLLHRQKFAIRTIMGIWEIDNGNVRLVAPDPNYQPEEETLVDCRLRSGAEISTTKKACRNEGGVVLK